MKKLFYPLTLLAIIFAAVLLTITTSCSKDEDKQDDSTSTTGGTDDGKVTLSKKYEIEKGIFVLKNFNTLMDEITYDTVYFKEYGAIEAKYSYDEKNLLKDLDMQIGDGFLYQINMQSKAGMKSVSSYARGTEYSPDFETWTAEYKTKYKVKTLSDTTIAGKNCKFYYYEASATTPTRAADYKKICMFFEVSSKGSFAFTTTYVVVSLQENATIPDAKFKVPSGITYSSFK